MLPTHLRYPLLAISTDPRQVGVACVDHELELVCAKVHDTRPFVQASPDFVSFLERSIQRDLARLRAKTLVVAVPARAGPVRDVVIAAVSRVADRHEVRAEAIDPAEALAAIGYESLRVAVEGLSTQYARCRCPCPPHMLANDRPVLAAIVVAHAVAFASLAAEATETDGS